MKPVRLPYTTAAGGGATASVVVPGGGIVEAIDYLPGTTDTGATITVTDERGGASFTIWNKATAGTSNIRVYPRALQVLNTDGSNLSTHSKPVVAGTAKVTVASGGATKSGAVVLYISEL